MNFLVYDTETTDLVKLRMPLDHPKQPHLVQLACLLIDEEGNELQSASFIIKPEGFEIPEKTAGIHGITTEMALELGVPLRLAIATFTNLRAVADATVAHNEEFDSFMMRIEMARVNSKPAHPGPTRHICTAQESATLVNLPPTVNMIKAGYGNKPKTPKLEELHQFAFNESFDGAHNAMIDVRACARCLLWLRKEHNLCQ